LSLVSSPSSNRPSHRPSLWQWCRQKQRLKKNFMEFTSASAAEMTSVVDVGEESQVAAISQKLVQQAGLSQRPENIAMAGRIPSMYTYVWYKLFYSFL